MTYTASTPYRSIGDVPLSLYVAEFERVGSPMLEEVTAIHAAAVPHSALFLAMAWHEQQYATTSRSIRPDQHNPVGLRPWYRDPHGDPIGVTGYITAANGGQYIAFDSFANCVREWKRRLFSDPEYKGGIYARLTTLADMIGTYAPAGDIHEITGIDNADSGYVAGVLAKLNQWAGLIAGGMETTTMATSKPYILLVAGHNSVGDGGNPVERALTPNLARAYLAAFKTAGYPVSWINPTLYPGGLDGLALACGKALANRDDDLSIMLDLHFNGSRSGVHAIAANNRKATGGQLSTAYVQGRVAEDVVDYNTLDVTIAKRIAASISAIPGMTLWGSDGLMREDQTGVGLKGYRLAMMAATAPSREKAVRITVEHGGTDDASRPNFYANCARAAVDAVTEVMVARGAGGGSPAPNPDPVPEPEPPAGDPGGPTLPAFLFGSVQGYQFDPNGPVSNLWLQTGNATDRWPRLVDVFVDGTTKFFTFADGSVIVAEPGKPVAYLQDVAA